MKKMISMALALILMLTLAACGGDKTVTAPDDSVYKADVQAYITDVLDSTAEISIFEKKSADLNGSTLTATCVAIYNGAEGQTMATFILTYVSGKDGWTLDKCRVEMDESNAPADSNTPSETTPPATTPPPATTTPPAPEVTISDNWKDFTIELDGHVYQLPCRYEEFAKNGFVIGTSYSDVQETDKLGGYTRVSVYLTNGAVDFNADLINLSGNARIAKDCDIGGISIAASDNLGLKLAKGIHSLSTVEEVQAAFGTPSSISTYDDSTSMSFSAGDYVDMKFYIDDNTKYNTITLRNYIADERDVTETSNERPAYLNTYVAPGSMSNSPTSTQFQLDGVVYHLPCPLSTFTDNGWTIKSDSIGYLGAYNQSSGMTLEKNGVNLYVSLKNFADVQVGSANCAVSDVSFYSYDFEDVDSNFLTFPSGLNINSTLDDIAKACQDFETYDGSSYVSYSAQNDDYTWTIKYVRYDDYLVVSIKDIIWDY